MTDPALVDRARAALRHLVRDEELGDDLLAGLEGDRLIETAVALGLIEPPPDGDQSSAAISSDCAK